MGYSVGSCIVGCVIVIFFVLLESVWWWFCIGWGCGDEVVIILFLLGRIFRFGIECGWGGIVVGILFFVFLSLKLGLGVVCGGCVVGVFFFVFLEGGDVGFGNKYFWIDFCILVLWCWIFFIFRCGGWEILFWFLFFSWMIKGFFFVGVVVWGIILRVFIGDGVIGGVYNGSVCKRVVWMSLFFFVGFVDKGFF